MCAHLSFKAVTSLFHQGWNARDACLTPTHMTDLSSWFFLSLLTTLAEKCISALSCTGFLQYGLKLKVSTKN